MPFQGEMQVFCVTLCAEVDDVHVIAQYEKLSSLTETVDGGLKGNIIVIHGVEYNSHLFFVMSDCFVDIKVICMLFVNVF